MTTIRANVSEMFRSTEPYDCSNNQVTLGDQCARLTWTSALRVAAAHERWLLSPLEDACEGMREWARETGAWDREERDGWTAEECLGLFVQNVASELRMLGSDEHDLHMCCGTYEATDWDSEPEYPIGSYYVVSKTAPFGGHVEVEYYTGV